MVGGIGYGYSHIASEYLAHPDDVLCVDGLVKAKIVTLLFERLSRGLHAEPCYRRVSGGESNRREDDK